MDWLHNLPAKAEYIFMTWGMVYPVAVFAVGLLIILAFPSMRRALRDKLALAGFVTVPLFWIGLVPESIVFLNLPDSPGPFLTQPDWAIVSLPVAAVGSVVMGLLLLARARGVRWLSVLYIAINAFCCLSAAGVLYSSLTDSWM